MENEITRKSMEEIPPSMGARDLKFRAYIETNQCVDIISKNVLFDGAATNDKIIKSIQTAYNEILSDDERNMSPKVIKIEIRDAENQVLATCSNKEVIIERTI